MPDQLRKRVDCECGQTIEATADDELVRLVNEHTLSVHELKLPEDVIFAKARPVVE